MEDKIIKMFEEHNGVLSTKEIESNGFSRVILKKYIENDKIEKIKRGLYILKGKYIDEFYIFQRIYPGAIFSYNTALYFHNLSERTPRIMDVTIYTGYNPHRFDSRVNVHRVSKKIINLGVIKMKSPQGMKIRVYDIERTVCDIIKNNKNMDLEETNKVIKNSIRSKNFDIDKMLEYAKKIKVYKK
jgi:predicted transcriptional regulator of viral defense system